MTDIVVIGAGIAGLLAAARASEGGAKVTVVSFGIGGLQLGHGCLDILGRAPDAVDNPLAAIDGLAAEHPYRVFGAEAVRAGAEYAAAFFGPDLLVGNPDANQWLPTALGGLRPTAYASPSMVGPLDDVLVIGLAQLKDFQPELFARNLRLARPGTRIKHRLVDFPARPGEVDSQPHGYARSFADPNKLDEFVRLLDRSGRASAAVALPAVLGLDPNRWRQVSERLGKPIIEVPTPPPSVPGMRLNTHALARLRAAGVRIINGSRAVALHAQNDRVDAVEVATTGHPIKINCAAVIHAPGGFESGSLTLDSHGKLTERLGLPVWQPDGPPFVADRRADQPLWRAGLRIDAQARVLDAADQPIYRNLYAAGGVLAGAVRWREKSGEGIAAVSALRAAEGALA